VSSLNHIAMLCMLIIRNHHPILYLRLEIINAITVRSVCHIKVLPSLFMLDLSDELFVILLRYLLSSNWSKKKNVVKVRSLQLLTRHISQNRFCKAQVFLVLARLSYDIRTITSDLFLSELSSWIARPGIYVWVRFLGFYWWSPTILLSIHVEQILS